MPSWRVLPCSFPLCVSSLIPQDSFPLLSHTPRCSVGLPPQPLHYSSPSPMTLSGSRLSTPLSTKLNHLPPFTPFSNAVNIRSVHTEGSVHLHLSRIWTSPSCLGFSSAFDGLSSFSTVFTHPPSCLPLLHIRYDASLLLWRL